MNPLVVLIDDDVREHQRLQALLPEVALRSYYTAQQALAGVRALRAGPAPLALIVLDYRLPDLDGAMLAPLLQALAPTARVLPYSNLPESGPLIGFTTALPLLRKASPDPVIRATLLHALDLPATPQLPADPVVSRYLADHAAQRLAGLRHQPQVALFTGARAILQLLADALHAQGLTPALQGTSAPALQLGLARLPIDCIVADEVALERAAQLAHDHRLPLILVALRPSAALAAVGQVRAIVLDLAQLGAAVAALQAGADFHDPQLAALLAQLALSPQEERLLPAILRDTRPAVAAAAFGMLESAFRKARSRLFQRFAVETAVGLRHAIDTRSLDTAVSPM